MDDFATQTANQIHSEASYWLALLRTPGLGSRGIIRLLDHLQQPSAVFSASAGTLAGFGLKRAAREHLLNTDWHCIEDDLDWLDQPHNHIISIQDPEYPALLKEIPDPPPLLFVHGQPQALHLPQLAIVGSRNPSHSGRETARHFAHHLAAGGLAITSGLAIGVDAASHQGALDAEGVTIAVAGTGLDRIYPGSHRDLARQIAQNGALISEFPLGTPARAGHFPRRNRIISGLSLGTLVIEAALKSGSLITAHQAAEQGREIFAIPGSIHNPLARGCHQLIRQGAKLVETAQDIVEELIPLLGSLQVPSTTPPPERNSNPKIEKNGDFQALLRNLGFDPAPIDQIIAQSGLTPEKVSSMLLLLELEGYVSSSPGGRYCRTGKG
jgi:DNA processing protein